MAPSKKTTTGASDEKIRKNGLAWAKKKFETTFEGSEIADQTADLPKFDFDEVVLGKVLGKGGFGTVSEVRAFKVSGVKAVNQFGKSRRNVPKGGQDDAAAQDGEESRQFIGEHCVRNGGDARYALKILSTEVIADTGSFLQGVIDMAVESRFLSDIEHPNIIKIRALAKCEAYDEKYFIVMDRLYDTLEKRIDQWAGRLKKQSGMFRDRTGEKTRELYEERVVVAFDLASAVEFLHTRHILYRDLKPENVGFDIRDDVKLFDFGLAKELRESMMCNDGTYKLTAMSGSPRYMAPEVGLGQPYKHTCDSYSFAILLWQILACKEPFEGFTMTALKSRVWAGEHKRPFIHEDWTVAIKLLLKRSWSEDLHARNSMESICKMLREECVRVRDGDEAGLEHLRRRSTFVFRPKKEEARNSPARGQRVLLTRQ